MALVVCGRLNKQVGGELGISEITVKAHRGRLMSKMHAASLADLVNMAATLRLAPVPEVLTGTRVHGRRWRCPDAMHISTQGTDQHQGIIDMHRSTGASSTREVAPRAVAV